MQNAMSYSSDLQICQYPKRYPETLNGINMTMDAAGRNKEHAVWRADRRETSRGALGVCELERLKKKEQNPLGGRSKGCVGWSADKRMSSSSSGVFVPIYIFY